MLAVSLENALLFGLKTPHSPPRLVTVASIPPRCHQVSWMTIRLRAEIVFSKVASALILFWRSWASFGACVLTAGNLFVQ